MNRLFAKLFFISARYPKYLWGIVLVLTCISGVIVARTHFVSDMRELLPRNSASYRNLNAVIDSGMANRITFYVSRKDGGELDNLPDMKAMERCAEALRAVEGVNQVVTAVAVSSQEELFRNFVSWFPLYYSPSQLPQQNELKKCFQRNIRTLYLNPLGGSAQCRYDPLGWTARRLGELENILKISGSKFYPGNTSFVFSPDRKVCMMLIYTDVSPSDYLKSRRLVEALQKAAAALPENLKSEFFCSHLHMLENASIMQTDLWIFAICTLLLFAALFAFVYKWDLRGIVIPFLVGLGSLWAAAVLGAVFEAPLVFTLAMGGVLMGIAGDYGIHLYAVSFSGRRVQDGIALCSKLMLAFLTTAAAFFGFMFSGVPAFVQFGAYSVLTLLFAFVLLLASLPGALFFHKSPRKAVDFYSLFHLQGIKTAHVWICLILLVCLGGGIFKVKFDSDIRKFDIAFEKSIQREAFYQQAFTKKGHPFLIFYSSEKSFDALLEKCRSDKESLLKLVPGIRMVSPADFFVPQGEMKNNLQQWKGYLSSGEWEKYKKMFLSQAEKSGFTREFFNDFFERIEKSVSAPPEKQPEMLSFVYKSMVGKSSRWTGVAMVDKSSVDGEKLLKNSSGVLFAEDIFTRQLFKDILGQLPAVIPWVLLTVFLLVVVTLRSFARACLAFLPVAACLAGIAGVHGVLGHEISLAVVVAGIVTVGIAVDYGILLVNSDLERHIFNSISFSAITTAVGGLTVLFIRHPMLRAAGLTILAGILTAGFFTFCLLYPILKMMRKKGLPKAGAGIVLMSLFFAASGCSSLPREEILPLAPLPENVKMQLPSKRPGEFQGNLILDYRTGQNVFLIAGKMHNNGREGCFYGFSPGGIRIFSLEGEGLELKKYQWMKNTVPEKQQEKVSRFLYRAIAAGIYVPATVRVTAGKTPEKAGGLEIKCADGGELSLIFSGPQGEIARKIFRQNGRRCQVEYCRKLPGSDCVYIYSEKSFLQAHVKMKFFN